MNAKTILNLASRIADLSRNEKGLTKAERLSALRIGMELLGLDPLAVIGQSARQTEPTDLGAP